MKLSSVTIAKYTFLEAIKNHLFLLVIGGIIIIFSGGLFVAELSVTETHEMQSAVTGFILRLYSVIVVSLFVITSVLREINDKTLEIIISQNLPRYVYYLGKLSGFIALVVVISLLVSIPLFFSSEPLQVLLWMISLICELAIVVTLCLLFLFTFENVTTTFTATAAFYILARSISTIQLISQSPVIESDSIFFLFTRKIIDFFSYILPHIDSFTQTGWLVYGTGTMNDMIFVISQMLIYVILVSSAALYDFYRKNF